MNSIVFLEALQVNAGRKGGSPDERPMIQNEESVMKHFGENINNYHRGNENHKTNPDGCSNADDAGCGDHEVSKSPKITQQSCKSSSPSKEASGNAKYPAE